MKHKIMQTRNRGNREHYEQCIRFLKAVSEGDPSKARECIKDDANAVSLYNIIVKKMDQNIALEKRYLSLKRKYLQIQEINKKTCKQMSEMRAKKITSLDASLDMEAISQKLLLLGYLEDGFVGSAKKLAAKYKFSALEEVVQLLLEYKWILNKMEFDTPESPKEKGFAFVAQRATIYNDILEASKAEKKIEEILLDIANRRALIGLEDKGLSKGTREAIKYIYSIIQEYRKRDELCAQQEARLKQLMRGSCPGLRYSEGASFYSVVEKLVTVTSQTTTESSLKNTFKTRKMSECTEDFQLHKITVINKSAETSFPVFSAKELKLITKRIEIIGCQLKEAGKLEEKVDGLYQLAVLERVSSVLAHLKMEKQLHELIVTQGEEAASELISLNQSVIHIGSVPNQLQIDQADKDIKNICKALKSNLVRVVQKCQTTVASVSTHQNHLYAKTASTIFEGEDDFEEILEIVSRQQLIRKINQLRNNLSLAEEEIQRHKQSRRMMQTKLKSQQKQLNSSIFLISEYGKGEVDYIQIDELKLQLNSLKKELFRKEQRCLQLQNNIPRLVNQAKISVEEERDKYIRKYKETDRLLNQTISSYNLKLEEKHAQWSSKINQLEKRSQIKQTLQGEKLAEAEAKLREIESEKEKLERINQDLKLKNKSLSESQEDKKGQDYNQMGVGLSQIDEVPSPLQKQGSINVSVNVHRRSTTNDRPSTPKEIKINPVQQKQVQKLRQDVRQLQEEIGELRIILTDQQKIIRNKDIIIRSTEQKIEEMEAQQRQSVQVYQARLAKSSGSDRHSNLFVLGSIFNQGGREERAYLIESLQSFVGPIKKSLLLYRYDPFNRTNPHKYIDQRKHILIIVRTIFGKHIAAYSQEMIDPKGCRPGFGLLLSLWNQETFEVIQGRKAVTYDDFFMIFGNSELRIKSQDVKVFSNFGINNGHFDSRGRKVDAFLGEGRDREVNIDSYEIYQLQMANGYY